MKPDFCKLGNFRMGLIFASEQEVNKNILHPRKFSISIIKDKKKVSMREINPHAKCSKMPKNEK